MTRRMRYFLSYDDTDSFEITAGEASRIIDLWKKKYRHEIIELKVGSRQIMCTHSFYDKELKWMYSVVGIILEEPNKKEKNKNETWRIIRSLAKTF